MAARFVTSEPVVCELNEVGIIAENPNPGIPIPIRWEW
jgi:hypothetical protein